MPAAWGWGPGLLSTSGVGRGLGRRLVAPASVASSSWKSWALQALLAEVTSPCQGHEGPWRELRGGRSSRTRILPLYLAVLPAPWWYSLLQTLGLGGVALLLGPRWLEARGALVQPGSCSAQPSGAVSQHGAALV